MIFLHLKKDEKFSFISLAIVAIMVGVLSLGIYYNNNTNNKSMLIKVVDDELINMTGGIIQRNEWSSNNTKQ